MKEGVQAKLQRASEQKKVERVRAQLADKAKQQMLEQKLQDTRDERKKAETQLKNALLQGSIPLDGTGSGTGPGLRGQN